jgi:uncharacterized protein
MSDDDLYVVYRKYDGSLHWHLTMQWLAEDEHGIWAGLPEGGTMRRGEGPLIAINSAHVTLFPRDAWWTAVFNAAPEAVEIYCDITTPVVWTTPRECTMVDLDLDVVRMRDTGAVELLDEDEFAEHQVAYGYPPDVIDRARRTADRLLVALGDGSEPFATAFAPHLARTLPDETGHAALRAPHVDPLSARLLGRAADL